MNILSKEELEILSQVKTTVSQARRILKRNIRLLKFLNSLPDTRDKYEGYDGDYDFYGEVGCPHCEFPCRTCAWSVTCKNGEERSEACLRIKFGGISYRDLTCHSKGIKLIYTCDEERIEWNYNFDKKYVEKLELMKRFVGGHIEWANHIIERRSWTKTKPSIPGTYYWTAGKKEESVSG